MRMYLGALLLWCCCVTPGMAEAPQSTPSLLDWSGNRPPALPDEEGFAGMFAGRSHGALIAAGGANFPESRPWEGGAKVWYDQIFVLEPGSSTWRRAEVKLPRPLAYGVSITYKDQLICIGGGDGQRHHREVFALRYEEGRIQKSDLPPLPEPVAQMCGALIGSKIYLLGGIARPDAAEALQKFWMLDLAAPAESMRWQVLEPWPGPERMQATCATFDGRLYLFGGVRLKPDAAGRPQRIAPYLSDAYCYTPATDGIAAGWEKLPDLPRATAASPSPSPSLPYGRIVILGGVDGSTLGAPPEKHPPLDRTLLVYNTTNNTWATLPDALPEGTSRVTAPVTRWQDGWLIVSGEKLPGVRSPRVDYFRQATASFGWINWSVLIGYLGLMVVIGMYFSGREETTADFFLAGGRIPWWAAGLSIFGTQLSAITFMTAPAIAYAEDWTRVVGGFTILAVVPLVTLCYLPFFRRLNAATAYEYLEKRFHPSLRLLGSASFILFQLSRMGIVLYLPAIALAAVTGMDVYLCIVAMGVVATLYTVAGGMEAVIWTDVVQVVVLLAGALIAAGMVVASEGGWNAFVAAGMADGKFEVVHWGGGWSELNIVVLIVGFAFINLTTYTTDQAVVQRYLTTRDERAAARSIWINGLMAVPTSLLFCGLGTALYVYYEGRPELATPAQIDQIVPWFIVHELPVGVAGLVIAGIFAAAMSSLDSSMNSVATAWITDFYRRRRVVSESRAVKVAKIVTALVGGIGTATAMLMASVSVQSLFDLFQTLVGLAGGGLCGVFVLGIFTRRAHWIGALAGLLAGSAAPLILGQLTTMHSYLYCAAGVLVCVAVGLLVSLLAPARQPDLAGLTLHTPRKRDATRPGELSEPAAPEL